MPELGKMTAGPRPFRREKEKVSQVRFPEEKQQQLFSLLKWIVIALLLALAIFATVKLSNPQTLPIRTVKVIGNYDRVDHSLLRQTIYPFLPKGFLAIDTAALTERLQQLPWVASVGVHRAWPDTLIIQLNQQQALARFNETSLLNAQGELFSVSQNALPTNLPLFIGIPGQQEILLQNYQKMLTILLPLKLGINILALDARQSWRIQLSNGIVLFVGQTDPLERLQRFVTAYPTLVGSRAAMVNYVDLRYAHGFAVKYKEQ